MRVLKLLCAMLIFVGCSVRAQTRGVVVADSVTHQPLPGASVFDRIGKMIGVSSTHGHLPIIPSDSYPATIRYIGFNEKQIASAGQDTIFMQENTLDLPEVVVESGRHKVLHMLAYIREYSTLTTYSDTVFLFREKMVDYMLAQDKKVRFKGWTNPRILTCRSYYRFTDAYGLDSVSDESRFHFSWSDWVGVPLAREIPEALWSSDYERDTLYGKYSPTEIWARNSDRITIDVNVLADSAGRKWVPNLRGFFSRDLDFENFRMRFNYNNVIEEKISPADLTSYSFNIESQGRGHGMFKFNRINQPFFVSTYAEVYILDKEYITVKEARQWENRHFDTASIGIYEAPYAPALQPAIEALVERVNRVNKGNVRLAFTPDHRLAGKKIKGKNMGARALQLLRIATGMSRYKMNKSLDRQWREFRQRRSESNNDEH